MAVTKEDIIRRVKEEKISFIRLQFSDIFGQMKNVAIPASQIEKAVNNQIMFDGSSIVGFVRIEESDQHLFPDLESFEILPWLSGREKTARLICDVHDVDGSPFVGDPRSMLKKTIKRAEEMGYSNFNVGPECEFFLFETDERGEPTTETIDKVGYFDFGPLDRGEQTRRNICLALEDMGFEIEASHHETAAGQHEIDFKYASAVHAADNIMTFKSTVKTIALQDGLHATFMPKPIFGVAGSGMHTNMSLFRDGKNVFYDPNGVHGLSEEAYAFMAGILEHIKGFTAITNPLVNSYKRLVPGYEAPCYISWSASNRSALVRVPNARGQSTRLELRSPDPTCNPYLALSCCLAAGLDGIKRGLTPPTEVTENIYAMSAAERAARGIGALPASLDEALRAMEEDPVIMETLGDHIAQNFIDGKRKEWQEYCTRVSSWEREKYIVLY